MYTILAKNVNDAFYQGMSLLQNVGVKGDSRNGPVIQVPTPVVTTYMRPKERVLFCPERDANPFFHFMEGLWMLGGRMDCGFVAQFNGRMREYANDVGDLDGAYGYRWRTHFGYDQLQTLISMLKNDPNTRRAVLAMWDGYVDLGRSSLDIPCNTHAYFRRDRYSLHMTVCCRSNDAVWGAYGANAVHMSMLQEVLATMIGCDVGEYNQFSNNMHLYPEVKNHRELLTLTDPGNPYPGLITHVLVNHPDTWFSELDTFLRAPEVPFQCKNGLFYYVAFPMYRVWQCYKKGMGREALAWVDAIEDEAWKLACTQWIQRRLK